MALTNGPARTLRCRVHADKWVTIFGVPGAVAWCSCGRVLNEE